MSLQGLLVGNISLMHCKVSDRSLIVLEGAREFIDWTFCYLSNQITCACRSYDEGVSPALFTTTP